MKPIDPSSRVTARQNVVSALSQEILSGIYDPKHPIPSEHQLCRRFGVSRVTIRLALSDLQNRGLIYRHHGKGTFIHGAPKLGGKPLGILMRKSECFSCAGLAELLRGFQTYLTFAETYSVNIGVAPASWPPAIATALGGVMVIPHGVVASDMENLKKRHLPYLVTGGSDLAGPSVHLGVETSSQEVVTALAERGLKRFAFLHGNESPYDRLRQQGISKALSLAGLGPKALVKVECKSDCQEIRASVARLLDHQPLPQAVLVSESAHVLALLGAARERGLTPGKDIHIVCLSRSTESQMLEPSITTVEVPFFEGGRKAAEMLCRAGFSGLALDSVNLSYRIHWAA